MSISSSVVLGHRPPRSSSTIYIGPPRGDSERSAPLVSPRTPGDKKRPRYVSRSTEHRS
ncbi:uncharacterized protein BKA55DRAFT_583272 [Fusarium redolens]|uniref:Uncharacterized protein n=1 Tax=Fusarium redolens TaxID=48865 RepID=A0A9P9G2B6_FUSRE|nr:uncharacterized protein BKA55DRAFT_583272 [Fusarium redolens]KAH7230672.1 hypothetical protein BKA55DRAFT_583272 [Fusarium redolens]